MKEKTIISGLTKLIVVLLIILLCAISFLGIHQRDLNGWKNILPDYVLGTELGEARSFNFEISDDTEEVEVESKTEEPTAEEATEGNTEATETTETEAAAQETTPSAEAATPETTPSAEPTTTEVPVNKPENLNAKNYKKAKEIVEKRLHLFGINDKTITIDETTGKLSMILPNTKSTDYAVALVTNLGKLEIVDSDTKEVLIDNSMISKVTDGYNTAAQATAVNSNSYDIGISIEFNTKGQNKLNEITKTYIESVDESGATVQKTVTVKLDGEDRYRTYFDPEGAYTSIFIPLYQNVSGSESKTFTDNYNDCLVIASAINGGVLPVKYEVTTGTYVGSNLGDNFVRNAIIVIAVILGAVGIYMLIKYGKEGFMFVIIELGYVALLALFLRAASVTITLIGLITFLLMAFLNYYLIVGLKDKEKIKGFGKFLGRIIPLIIAIIVFVFATDINANSMGMVGFWSIIAYVYTFLVSLILLNNNNKEGAKKHE